VAAKAKTELSAEQCREVAAWIEANREHLPAAVRAFLALHEPYLAPGRDPRRALEAAWRELHRALHIMPSSEKRRPSGSPLARIPRAGPAAKSNRERIEALIARGKKLAGWHRSLKKRHNDRVKVLKEKLAKMPKEQNDDGGTKHEIKKVVRLEDIPLTKEELAEAAASGVGDRFVEHLLQGSGADSAMKSVNETLMPGGAVLVSEEHVSLEAVVPEDLVDGEVVKTLSEERVRYDFSVAVTRIELDIEKKVVVDQQGDRHVIAPSTIEYGPPRYSVTWSALATLTVLVGQFALPFNRLGTMFSTPEKRFSAGALSRMLHYVAQRLVPIYLELWAQLANCEILAGDDTSCRVLEVSTHFAKSSAETETLPPWADYKTPSVAEESFRRSEEMQKARARRREEGDRSATRTPEETPSIGVLIARKLGFESPRRNGDGPKEAIHVSVISGRSIAEDPQSLIVFFRSHIGSCGNLFESILKRRDPRLRKVVIQSDMSTTNLVTSSELLEHFDIRAIGCSAHARRPFAVHEDEDPERCAYMLHLFLGLAFQEEYLDALGRNRDNVLAVRGNESRELWNDILDLAKNVAETWSKATKLGTGARYIINHFDALTAYLDDPRLEQTNNMRERMLRIEKLIEGSSMFRRSLEGRFVLDVVRTILQTAVAAGVPVHEYLVSVLRASDDDVAKNPNHFTPRAWAAMNLGGNASATAPPSPASPAQYQDQR
jgi:hypothetical protein